MPESLKADTCSKIGKGVRKYVDSSNTFPEKWLAFLRIDENKTELLSFLQEGSRH